MATNTSLLDGLEFSDIATWEAAVDGTSPAGDIERLDISIVGSEAGTINIAGFTEKTGDGEIQIRWLGDSFHDGDVNSTSSNAYVIEKLTVNDGGCRIDGAFGDKAIGSATGTMFFFGSGADGKDCFFLNTIANANGEAGRAFQGNAGGTANQYCINCVALNSDTGTSSYGYDTKIILYNCIAYKMGRGVNGRTCFNCWFLDSANQDVRDGDYSYCAFNTETGTPVKTVGNNDIALLIDTDTEAADTIRVTSLTAGSEDFILLDFSGSPTNPNWALGAGNDFSGTFSEQATDIIGTARSAQDVGAYEVIVAAGAAPNLLTLLGVG